MLPHPLSKATGKGRASSRVPGSLRKGGMAPVQTRGCAPGQKYPNPTPGSYACLELILSSGVTTLLFPSTGIRFLSSLIEPALSWGLSPHLQAFLRTSLVVQWIRICLSMQETTVPSLVQEDPTCLGAFKLTHLSLSAAATEALTPRTCAPQEEPLQ